MLDAGAGLFVGLIRGLASFFLGSADSAVQAMREVDRQHGGVGVGNPCRSVTGEAPNVRDGHDVPFVDGGGRLRMYELMAWAHAETRSWGVQFPWQLVRSCRDEGEQSAAAVPACSSPCYIERVWSHLRGALAEARGVGTSHLWSDQWIPVHSVFDERTVGPASVTSERTL